MRTFMLKNIRIYLRICEKSSNFVPGINQYLL